MSVLAAAMPWVIWAAFQLLPYRVLQLSVPSVSWPGVTETACHLPVLNLGVQPGLVVCSTCFQDLVYIAIELNILL